MEKGKVSKTSDLIFHMLSVISGLLVVAAVIAEPSLELLVGLWKIMTHEAGLITDPIATGGLGAALLNTGLVLACGIALARFNKLPFTGATISCLLMATGFSMIGKNILNIQPLLLGGWLFARFSGEGFERYVYLSFSGACMAPLVSYVICHGGGSLSWVAALMAGAAIGFVLPPVAAYATRIHQGYNLLNIGFAVGFIGMIVVNMMRGFGLTFETEGSWNTGSHTFLVALMLILSIGLIVGGIWQGCRLERYTRLLRRTGRAVSDFVVMDGLPTTLVNMGICTLLGTLFYLLIGEPFSGPMVGSLLTVCGYAAFGAHPRNYLPVLTGAACTALAMGVLRTPEALTGVILSVALSPIGGHFGPFWGFVAGCAHMALVLNVGTIHGKMDLYNNGFAAGLVCVVLVPLIEALQQESNE